MKKVAGGLKLDLAQYRELQAFSQFGSDLDKSTLARLNRGARLMEILKQGVNQPLQVEQQVVSLYSAVRGYLDDIPVIDVRRFEKEFIAFIESNRSEILQSIRDTKDLVADNETALKDAIETFKKGFSVSA
ncbi:ATP synthase subunit alpha [compost metagenome]